MGGRVVVKPDPPHHCAPGVTYGVSTGADDTFPAGQVYCKTPTPWDYPKGTVWQCDCGRIWVSLGSPHWTSPGVCDWRRVGRLGLWWMRVRPRRCRR